MDDRRFLARAFQLAKKGLYTADPNPRVGCVLVRDGRILAEGFHRQAGEPHAEANALANATESVVGATAYVTLEPCSFHGRTPACAEALIKAGISRVVAAAEDPHPRNRGAGFERLQAAGLEVIPALDPEAAERLNPGHMMTHSIGRPFIRLKLAATMDGFTALPNGESQWITGPAARLDVQRLRARSSAIVTGANTVLVDDPRLTVRDPNIDAEISQWLLARARPVYVLDSKARTTSAHRIYQNPLAVQVCTDGSAPTHATSMITAADETGRVDLVTFCRALAERGHLELLFECGPVLAGAMIEAELVDELIVYLAPKFMGQGMPLLQLPELAKMTDVHAWQIAETRRVGPDLKLTLKPSQSE